jgi:hypothetical protein
MSMVVDLTSQHAFVYRGEKLIGMTTISSGRPGYATPDGTFTVLQKEKMHHSNKYEDAPMPFMERLTWDGLALHGGHPRGWPASHGCIRMPMGFAAALFKQDTRGMQVVITGDAPSKAEILAAQENARAYSTLCCKNDSIDSPPPARSAWEQGEPRALPEIPPASANCSTSRETHASGTGDDNDAYPAPDRPQSDACGNSEVPGQYESGDYSVPDEPPIPN